MYIIIAVMEYESETPILACQSEAHAKQVLKAFKEWVEKEPIYTDQENWDKWADSIPYKDILEEESDWLPLDHDFKIEKIPLL